MMGYAFYHKFIYITKRSNEMEIYVDGNLYRFVTIFLTMF